MAALGARKWRGCAKPPEMPILADMGFGYFGGFRIVGSHFGCLGLYGPRVWAFQVC